MTSIVAIRCKDGVVMGADSSATFGDGGHVRTIEQLTDRKIEIVGNTTKLIIAGTGYIVSAVVVTLCFWSVGYDPVSS
jgi:20S proteasome alpha/beta subunit